MSIHQMLKNKSEYFNFLINDRYIELNEMSPINSLVYKLLYDIEENLIYVIDEINYNLELCTSNSKLTYSSNYVFKYTTDNKFKSIKHRYTTDSIIVDCIYSYLNDTYHNVISTSSKVVSKLNNTDWNFYTITDDTLTYIDITLNTNEFIMSDDRGNILLLKHIKIEEKNETNENN